MFLLLCSDLALLFTFRNVPYKSQSTAVGIVTAASYVGTALAFGVSPYIITTFGWPVRYWESGSQILFISCVVISA